MYSPCQQQSENSLAGKHLVLVTYVVRCYGSLGNLYPKSSPCCIRSAGDGNMFLAMEISTSLRNLQEGRPSAAEKRQTEPFR